MCSQRTPASRLLLCKLNRLIIQPMRRLASYHRLKLLPQVFNQVLTLITGFKSGFNSHHSFNSYHRF